MSKVIFEKINGGYFKCKFDDILLAELIMDADGSFYIWITSNRGAWSTWLLKQITEKCDELNKLLERSIDEYFKDRNNDRNN